MHNRNRENMIEQGEIAAMHTVGKHGMVRYNQNVVPLVFLNNIFYLDIDIGFVYGIATGTSPVRPVFVLQPPLRIEGNDHNIVLDLYFEGTGAAAIGHKEIAAGYKG